MCSQMGKPRFHFILNSGPFHAALGMKWSSTEGETSDMDSPWRRMLSDWKCNLHLSVGPWRSCGWQICDKQCGSEKVGLMCINWSILIVTLFCRYVHAELSSVK